MYVPVPSAIGMGVMDPATCEGGTWLEWAGCKLGVYNPYAGVEAPPAPPLSQGVPAGALEPPYVVTPEAVVQAQQQTWREYQQRVGEFMVEQEQRDIAWQQAQDRLSLGLGIGTAVALGIGALVLILILKR